MGDSLNSNNDVSELIKSLQSVTSLMQNLVGDLGTQSISLALVKEKIDSISGRVESLVKIVIEGNGQRPVITRLALVEQGIKDVEKAANDIKEANANAVLEVRHMVEQRIVDDKKDATDDKVAKRDRSVAKWQTLGAALAAFSALALQIWFLVHK